jgi:membrane-bound serine protease (ClpP class)
VAHAPRITGMPSVFFALAIVTALLSSPVSDAQEQSAVYLLDLRGPIGPATSDYVHRGLEKVPRDKGALIILQIDTPGGLDTSMRSIIQDILQSPIPVVSFVAPSGARAASAGTYIMYASHVAVMAPGTNLGAATPVQIGVPQPPPLEKENTKQPPGKKEKAHPTMTDKIVNDAVAYIRSLAQLRGRNADWAEKAVREAASLSAEEALKARVIDVIATDVDDLLSKLSGREVVVQGSARRLQTTGVRVQPIDPDWRTELLGIITNPNIAYLLLLAGVFGLIIEFTSPGIAIPGVVGAISLLLALYAFQTLPTNYAGLALMFFGIALMIGEAFAPSFGSLGIGGIIAFVIGSVMLIDTDTPGYKISWALIGSFAVVSAVFIMMMMTLVAKSRRRPVVSGPEHMIGDTGQVIDWDGQTGRVRVQGEIWKARANEAFVAGRRVRVERIEGLTLVVQPDANRS